MFADIHEAAGEKRNCDLNSGESLEYLDFSNATFNGKRQWSTLYPRGENVTLWSSSHAKKFLFSGKRIPGVEVLRCGSKSTATARNEFIVSSGAQESPKLLLPSGIGPCPELQRYNIPQVVNLQVGESFLEHPFISTFWKLRDCGIFLGDMDMITPQW
ncbi:hypothetical protein VTL71DRAFT_13440 [Oculimacula yallundae]|uniref:Glucose-methanol-choline oxidoreductase N-terminal domain-containing protein n=1 Tax=Oculimacula yallundae TaxID=86028 RepID=A0ABR4CMV8_9HELO